MSEITAPGVTLADVERLCWHLSGWSVEQRAVDELLAAVQAYAGVQGAAQGSGALAPWPVGGEGPADGPERPMEGFSPPAALLETYETLNAAHTPVQAAPDPVQRIHVTGTLTLVCPGGCGPSSAAAATRTRTSKRKRVPKAERRRQPPSPDPHDPALPEDYRPCRVCQEIRPIGDFVKDTHGRRGRKTVCKDCENARKRGARQRQAG